ncbi:dihydropteroate synthase [Legionella geestiana]|uniref:dihydropteroate synthase n=1 Tax=Legionella geestiana TaxID=45065 RepID=UPI001C9E37F5|nr:dihydropteroate synthase [Legionella geestiana]
MKNHSFSAWCAAHQHRSPTKPLIMGILNVTPDSFHDGGRHGTLEAALLHARQMVADGADIIDIGGESSRPGATPVSVEEELRRVVPVVRALREESPVWISVDTTRAAVMREAALAGADILNDINGLGCAEMREVAAVFGLPAILMHKQGEPRTMQVNPVYEQDICHVVADFFAERIRLCEQSGIPRDRLVLDVGFGFGKTAAHNLRLVAHLSRFRALKLPLLLGASRKDTLGRLTGRDTEGRLAASLAVAAFAMTQGVGILRTHDVAETRDVINVVSALQQAQSDY